MLQELHCKSRIVAWLGWAAPTMDTCLLQARCSSEPVGHARSHPRPLHSSACNSCRPLSCSFLGNVCFEIFLPICMFGHVQLLYGISSPSLQSAEGPMSQFFADTAKYQVWHLFCCGVPTGLLPAIGCILISREVSMVKGSLPWSGIPIEAGALITQRWRACQASLRLHACTCQ